MMHASSLRAARRRVGIMNRIVGVWFAMGTSTRDPFPYTHNKSERARLSKLSSYAQQKKNRIDFGMVNRRVYDDVRSVFEAECIADVVGSLIIG